MGITADELVRMMDEYMSKDGFYMKPTAQGMGGQPNPTGTQVFSGRPTSGCATCADIPTLLDIDPDKE